MTMLEYFEALDRLKRNEPIRVAKGTRISNDSVSLEANRLKGSIKKSRPIFSKLIEAISTAAAEQEKRLGPTHKESINALKEEKERFKILYCESLNREVLLLDRLEQLEDELEKYRSGKVTNIKHAKRDLSEK